jgi:hypothetical protein
VARRALDALVPDAVVVGEGEMGWDYLCNWRGQIAPRAFGLRIGRARTQYLAAALAREGVDVIVVVGGDGTLADVALVLIRENLDTPILGVGVGSTNVGNLITCREADVEQLQTRRRVEQPVDALLASCNGELLGVGFNDVVVGFTVVGTIDGAATDVRVDARIAGRNVPGTPQVVWTANTRVAKERREGGTEIAQGAAVGTLAVGFAEAYFFGKAVTGPVCLTRIAGLPAGCLVCDQPLVQIRLDRRQLLAMEPFTCRYVSLDEGERIVGQGFREGAALCADGNPLHLLNERDRVEIQVKRRAVAAIKLAG